jgi:hypothetical protein
LRIFLRTLSPKTLVVVFVAVLILFRWLHLMLALEVAATGRQIQLASEELQRHEWRIDRLEKEIAEAESPRALAIMVQQLGLEPRQPEYVPLEEGTGLGVQVPGRDGSVVATRSQTEQSQPSVFDTISTFVTGSASVTVAP